MQLKTRVLVAGDKSIREESFRVKVQGGDGEKLGGDRRLTRYISDAVDFLELRPVVVYVIYFYLGVDK